MALVVTRPGSTGTAARHAATFAGGDTPLAGAGGGPFTVVAVWRVLPTAANGGGHPFNAGGHSVFRADAWVEGIAAGEWPRTMPAPTDVSAAGDVLIAVWKLVGGVLRFHLEATDEHAYGL